jgi:hypothetical protein
MTWTIFIAHPPLGADGLDEPGEALAQRDLGRPAEQRSGRAPASREARHVEVARRGLDDRGVGPGELAREAGELAEGGRRTREQVNRRRRGLAREEQIRAVRDAACGVVDVGEVEGVIGSLDPERLPRTAARTNAGTTRSG